MVLTKSFLPGEKKKGPEPATITIDASTSETYTTLLTDVWGSYDPCDGRDMPEPDQFIEFLEELAEGRGLTVAEMLWSDEYLFTDMDMDNTAVVLTVKP